MSCYICGGPIEDHKLDPRDLKTKPCSTCEAAIQECIEGYPNDGDEIFDPDDIYTYLEPDRDEFTDFAAPFGVRYHASRYQE